MARSIGHFIVIRRKHRAEGVVATVRQCSRLFKRALDAGDRKAMQEHSTEAWDALNKLFEILRNEQDHNNLAASFMTKLAGKIADQVSSQEQESMIASAKLDTKHPSYRDLTLRDALNKIAHFDTATANYRVDGRGAHYLVLAGKYLNKFWVAEILISRLCALSEDAVAGIT